MFLELFPIICHRLRTVSLYMSVNMGMAINKFVCQSRTNVSNVEKSFFLRDFCIKTNVQKNIAQFLTLFLAVITLKSIAKFVNLFYCIGSETFVGLFVVPRTLFPQFIKHIEQTSEGFKFLFSRIHLS